MILQKLASAIRRQDWFQVLIEVLIVIVGIFLGLQVSEWNEGRKNISEERNIVLSLKQELDEILEEKTIDLASMEEDVLLLRQSVEHLYDDDPSLIFNPEMCRSIATSFLVSWEYMPVSAAEELITSGRLNLIQNDELRLAIMKFRTTIEAHAYRNGYVIDKMIDILEKYPDLVYRNSIAPDSLNICATENMKLNAGFINDINSNRNRKRAMRNRMFIELDLLRELVTMIEEELERFQ